MSEDENSEDKISKLNAAIADANDILDSLEKKRDEAEASNQRAQTSSTEAQSFTGGAKSALNEIDAILGQIKASRDEAITILDNTKADAVQISEITKIAAEKDERVAEYEKELLELHDKYQEAKKKIETLLPAATNVGLAKAFNARRTSLEGSRRAYLALYIISILGFLALGFWALFSAEIKSITDFITFALERSPLIVGLILLEELSRRQFRTIVKLEEDYAYKETISMAFDGYKNAMAEVDASAEPNLATELSRSVLKILTQRPGELIEDDKSSNIPTDQILNVLLSTGQPDQKSQALAQLLKSLKGKWSKVLAIVVASALIGSAIGYYYADKSIVDVDLNMSIGDKKAPNK